MNDWRILSFKKNFLCFFFLSLREKLFYFSIFINNKEIFIRYCVIFLIKIIQYDNLIFKGLKDRRKKKQEAKGKEIVFIFKTNTASQDQSFNEHTDSQSYQNFQVSGV